MNDSKKKIAVGMSGGVDSSVAALILKQQGYNVVGLFMKLWHDPKCDISRENACCDDKALADAQKVATKIGIPLYAVDARAEFKKSVTDYFIDSYKNLHTPNPCIVCNNKIKFGWLLDFAQKIGCEYLATGHYARIVNSSKLSIINDQLSNNYHLENDQLNKKTCPELVEGRSMKNEKLRLLRGVDKTRDQSYFLAGLNQKQLSKIIFPLGEMTKDQVREIAKKEKLPVFEKAESREICFIPDDYRSFLKRYLSEDYFKPGKIVDKEGFTVGHHNGLVNYTIGQRKNVNQELRIMNKRENKTPLYVTGFDQVKNELIVGEEQDLFRQEFEIEDVNWINKDIELRIMNQELRDISVKVRYQGDEVSCSLSMIHDSKFIILLESKIRAIAPGQSAVFYSGDEVLGGGIIS